MDFATFARAHGLIINDLYPSDRVRRCATDDHPKKRNGAFKYDGHRGWVRNWSGDGTTHWWNDPNEKGPTPEQIKRLAEANERAAAILKARRRAAEQIAAQQLKTAVVQPHSYLHIKGFPDMTGPVLPSLEVWDDDLRQKVMVENVLLVPMRSTKNALLGVQHIWWDEPRRRYVKKMTSGMRAKGAILILGDHNAAETCLCEGYATGLSILEAAKKFGVRMRVAVCFSDSNMVYVSQFVKGRRYVFADNDRSGAGERAAKATGLPYCMADELGWDANDLHIKRGLMAVMHTLNMARLQA